MNQDLTSEDRTILAALDSLEGGAGEPVASPGAPSEADETLARLYTEVVGLVAYELAPEAPRPEAKARLLSAVRGEAAPEAPPEPRPAPAPAPILRAATSHEIPAAGRGAMIRRRRSVWPLALAATLVLALGGLSAWLLMERTEQASTIASLEKELAEVRRQAEQSEVQVRQMRGSMERMGENLAMVTSPAVTVSPLRPVGPPGEQSAARGMLFVAADHQHWYLAVHDLSPAVSGRDYQLWWVTDQGMVSGGTFEARQGEKVELSSETMPDNTRSVMITLEPEGGVRTPTGPEVLRGAGVYQIL